MTILENQEKGEVAYRLAGHKWTIMVNRKYFIGKRVSHILQKIENTVISFQELRWIAIDPSFK